MDETVDSSIEPKPENSDELQVHLSNDVYPNFFHTKTSEISKDSTDLVFSSYILYSDWPAFCITAGNLNKVFFVDWAES